MYQNNGEKWRAMSTIKAIQALKKHPSEITTLEVRALSFSTIFSHPVVIASYPVNIRGNVFLELRNISACHIKAHFNDQQAKTKSSANHVTVI